MYNDTKCYQICLNLRYYILQQIEMLRKRKLYIYFSPKMKSEYKSEWPIINSLQSLKALW